MRKKIYIAVFFIICIIPSSLMIVLGPSKALSNEIRSKEPRIGINTLEMCKDYMSDHFCLRPQMISVWNKINADIFKSSTTDKVLLGNDGFLFYGDDLDDYQGNHLSDEELDKIASNLRSFQDSVEADGSEFIFTIAPNKSSLYKDKMLKRYDENLTASNAVKIVPYLEKYEVNYVSLMDMAIPYYKTDSHWTSLGAAMVTDRLLGTSYSEDEFIKEGIYKGDLYEMLYPSFDGIESEVVHKNSLSFTAVDEAKDGNAIVFSTSGQGDKNVFVYRDSFGNSLYPYIAQASKEATFSRSVTFDAEEVKGSDIVIIEIVERNLDYLL